MKAGDRIRQALAWSLSCAALAGCAGVPAPAAAPLPGVAVLINRSWVEDDPRGFVWEVAQDERAVEARFAACVRDAVGAHGVAVRVLTGSEFRAQVFPDLDPRAAPRRLEVLRALLPDSRFRTRIEAAGIHYIAIVGGRTRTSGTQGGIVCVGGYGGGGCFGHLWWDHESRLSALVVDLLRGAEGFREGIEAAGTSHFGMLAIFPLAAPSSHEAEGCRRFGEAVASTLGGMLGRGD
ncbi:MAG: hypothetical protein LPJ94_03785 [Thauera sp.]|jgi:hypothetical protein|nr:hypothetical protein [Thauera sp.]